VTGKKRERRVTKVELVPKNSEKANFAPLNGAGVRREKEVDYRRINAEHLICAQKKPSAHSEMEDRGCTRAGEVDCDRLPEGGSCVGKRWALGGTPWRKSPSVN